MAYRRFRRGGMSKSALWRKIKRMRYVLRKMPNRRRFRPRKRRFF